MRMNPYVSAVEAQGNFTLNVTFETGERRRFDATPYLNLGVFAQLADREVFQAAAVVAGSVAWPGEIDLSYDTLYLEGNENLVNVTFDPWVGSQYGSSSRFRARILVLGESHYGHPSELCTAFTSNVVRKWAQARRSAFFTRVAMVLLDLDQTERLEDAERADVWENVAFYNFVQELVGPSPGQRPTPEMWAAGVEPLLGILRELDPDAVLVLGKELNRNLPSAWPQRIPKAHVVHPSARQYFNHDAANATFARLLAAAKHRS